MKKTTVLVTIILALTIIATVYDIIHTGTEFNWATVAPIYCNITCFFTCLTAAEKNKKEKNL